MGTAEDDREIDQRIEALTRTVERMATQHVTFHDQAGEEFHPDWCPLCRLEKAEAIGSPAAIADWIEKEIVPALGERLGLPPTSVDRGAVHRGASIDQLLQAIRDYEVLL